MAEQEKKGQITIIAKNIKGNAKGKILEESKQTKNIAGGKHIQNGYRGGVSNNKNKNRKPPLELRVLKVEGPFDEKGKKVEVIEKEKKNNYKVAQYNRTPTKEELKNLKWGIQYDEKPIRFAPNVMGLEKIFNYVPQEHNVSKVRVYAFFKTPNKNASASVNVKGIKFPILILQGSRRKGKKAMKVAGKTVSTDETSLDMLFGDYTENEAGYNKLQNELYKENYDTEKQDSFYNINSRSDNALENAKYTVSQIKEFTEKSNDDLFEIFRNDIEYYSKGELETVAQAMVDRMKTNTGGEYSNEKLTNAAVKHENSIIFISKVKEVINEYLKENKGNIENLEIKDNSNGKLYANLADNKKARNPQFSDKFGGLGITINDVWAYQIFITRYKINGNTFEMELEYIYYDHFGLDYPDIQKYDKDIFYSWFVLQHFRGYKPFITKLDIVGEFKGTF